MSPFWDDQRKLKKLAKHYVLGGMSLAREIFPRVNEDQLKNFIDELFPSGTPRVGKWSGTEVSYLKRHFSHHGMEELQAHLKRHNELEIEQAANILGLKKSAERPRNIDVDELKKLLQANDWNISKAAKSLGVSFSALRRRGLELGLLSSEDKKSWTASERKILATWYPSADMDTLMEKLPGRSAAAIYKMAARMRR